MTTMPDPQHIQALNPACVPTRGVRHPVTAMATARRLSADGIHDAEIGRRLAAQGHTVTPATIARWVRPSAAAAQAGHRERIAAQAAAANGRRGRLIPRAARPEFRAGRIDALAAIGCSDELIARLMTFDDPDRTPMTAEDVARALDGAPRPQQAATPTPITAQREAAMRKANRVRSQKVAVRNEIASGELSIPDALSDLRAASFTCRALLSSQFRWGEVRTVRALEDAGVDPGRSVGSLSGWECERIASAVSARQARAVVAALPGGQEQERAA